MALRNVDSLVIPDGTTAIPLLRWDSALISRLARAIDRENGEWPKSFGQVTVDQDGLVIGGVHRTQAARKRGLKKIPVTVREFADQQERLLFAVEDNAEHGKPWTPKEESQIAILAERYGIERSKVAEALRVPLRVIERKPIVNVVRRNAEGASVVVDRAYVPRPMRQALKNHSEVTEEVAAVMESFVTPHPVGVHLAEIIRISEGNAFPHLNADLWALVREANARLDEWVERDRHLIDGEQAA